MSEAVQPESGRQAEVVGIKDNILAIRTLGPSLMKNEVVYVHAGERRLMGETMRVRGDVADVQVFEDTRGVFVGSTVSLSREMLSATLGPGLLGGVFDGLLNPLEGLARDYGYFLPRGVYLDPLDGARRFRFEPLVGRGERVAPGCAVGRVHEGRIQHRIMLPTDLDGPCEVEWLGDGDYRVDDVVARLRRADGGELELTMRQKWPVRRPIPSSLLRRAYAERLYPEEPLTTTLRIIDTFFPIARGGTACIPGPFGAGKTVLQNLISRYADIDVVIVVACGERAGEVVETIVEFPHLQDPRSSGTLMERTVIICNTSSMPVAARESSIYTGITLGEYYRQMGLDVLVLADSTSRWAQAMRETSGRLEEIPGDEAFPAYLDSAIKNVYERAGVIRQADGTTGSLTLIGTVSPAGGNFEEPVTQSTLGTVKTFLGLSASRAYSRYYPAIDPLQSWSRYLEQLRPWLEEHLSPTWTRDVEALRDLLVEGDSIYQMMQVTGEEGVTLEDFVTWQKSVLVDTVYLQQDAFDDVDVSMPTARQVESLRLLKRIVDTPLHLADRDAARSFFNRLMSLYKNLNYSPPDTEQKARYESEIEALVAEHRAGGGES
ncbi:MAG: V-type ATP synthase subunit A [Myxococcales bacterium]|jgi:V/A-type H+-transporting ATPase subunit A